MSGIQVTTKIHFIAALLAHAIADVDFNSHKGVWITSDKLASALNMHYCIHSSLCFNGNELCTATCDKYLRILNGLGLGTINSNNLNWTHPMHTNATIVRNQAEGQHCFLWKLYISYTINYYRNRCKYYIIHLKYISFVY